MLRFHPFLVQCSVRCASPAKREYLIRAATGKGGLLAPRSKGSFVMFTPAGEFPIPKTFDSARMYDLFDALWNLTVMWEARIFSCLTVMLFAAAKSSD
ncbi:hypothetical protein [Singapore grouper iridovirus]|nr:hypothetical protein [Singapore grouper iridovirus]